MFEIIFGSMGYAACEGINALGNRKKAEPAEQAEVGTKDKMVVAIILTALVLMVVGCVAASQAFKAAQAPAEAPVVSAK